MAFLLTVRASWKPQGPAVGAAEEEVRKRGGAAPDLEWEQRG
jgi:hypothetical protein